MDASIYWTCDINPSNVDEHIFYAEKGGLKKILIYYTAMCIEDGYKYTGDYDLNEFFPNGFKDLEEMLNKIKKAGIIPGLHFLHSHIGIKSRYVTPKADHRLNHTRYLTLSKPLEIDDTVVYVEQNPEGTPLNPVFQVLKFDGEIIHYDSYTTEPPYCFKGCKRGYYNTDITTHSMGIIGGVLDISEFGAMSVYTDERTSLQDEVAEKIAKIYNTGFEFVYFDGSEGTNPPFEFYISYAQYKVYKKLKKEPLFCEGAAKTHFGWHMLSGGNAFDVFPTNLFKEKIAEFPMTAAPKTSNSFTSLNFGWWRFEELLKNTQQEYILILNEDNEYELTPYYRINNVAMGDSRMTAFYFERNGKTYVVCWHTLGEGKIFVPFLNDKFTYTQQVGGKTIDVKREKEGIILPLSKRSYFSSELSKKELIEIFENAHFI